MASVRKRTWTYKGVEKTAWVVDYTDLGGSRRQKTFRQKKDADRYRTKVETELGKGIHTPDSTSITVAKACDLWLDKCRQRLSRKQKMTRVTLYSYESVVSNHIKPFSIRDEKLSQLNAPRVQAWVDGLYYHPEKPRGDPTVERTVLCLRLAITHAQRDCP